MIKYEKVLKNFARNNFGVLIFQIVIFSTYFRTFFTNKVAQESLKTKQLLIKGQVETQET